MRKMIPLGLVLVIATALAGCGGTSGSGAASSAGSGQNVTIKLADDFPASDPFNQFLQTFASDVHQNSKGSVTIKLFTGNQLGGESDIVRGIANGTIEMGLTGVTGYAPLDAFFTPYAVASEKQLSLVLQNNILKQYFDTFEQQQKAHLVGSLYVSPREVTSGKPISTVSDIGGVKLRVPQIKSEVEVFKALGADPAVLAFPEVYTALQSGTVQAQENPVSTILSAKFYEVQKYLDMTNHGIQPEYVFVNTKTWAALSPEQQSAITSAFTKMQTQQQTEGAAAFDKDVAQLQQNGMTVVHPDNAAFRAKVYDSTVKPILTQLWGANIVSQVNGLPS